MVTSKVENLVFYKHEAGAAGVLFAKKNSPESSLFLEVQENIQQRSMTYVWKCKNTYHGVENEQNVITPPPHVFVLDFTLSGHSMNTEHSLHMLPRLKKRYRGIVCSLGTALTGYWPTEENQVRQPGRTL